MSQKYASDRGGWSPEKCGAKRSRTRRVSSRARRAISGPTDVCRTGGTGCRRSIRRILVGRLCCTQQSRGGRSSLGGSRGRTNLRRAHKRRQTSQRKQRQGVRHQRGQRQRVRPGTDLPESHALPRTPKVRRYWNPARRRCGRVQQAGVHIGNNRHPGHQPKLERSPARERNSGRWRCP